MAGILLLPPVLYCYGIDTWNWGILIQIGHLLTAAVLLPSSTLAAILLQKWQGPVRRHRLWIAGIAAVPAVWLGTLTCHQYLDSPNELLSPIFGDWTMEAVLFGWAVLWCNLTLLAAWALPVRFRKTCP